MNRIQLVAVSLVALGALLLLGSCDEAQDLLGLGDEGSVTITSPVAGSTISGSVTLSGSSLGDVNTITISTASGVIGSATPFGGVWQFEWDTTLIPDGTVDITISAYKDNELLATAVITVTITNTAPGQVQTPTFSPVAGTYSSDQSVSISTGTTGATIHYTTNGTDPTTGSPVYSGTPVSIAGHGTTMTIRAIAVKTGMTDSAEGSASYTITYPTVATPTFTPGGGTYSSDQSVTISTTTTGATIHYTTNGSTPTTGSPVYSGTPVSVAGHGTTMTIRALAVKSGLLNSSVGSASYTITYPTVATPTFTPGGGTYSSDQSVTISTTTTGATIHYTTNGSTPTTGSPTYSGTPVSVAGDGTTMTIRALAVKSGLLNSAEGSASYTITYGDGLVAHYPFDGNAVDVSGNSPTGVISGATPNTGYDGTTNGSYYFSGTATITVPKSDFISNSTMTFSAWIYPYIQGARAAVASGDGYRVFAISSYYYGLSVNLPSTNTATTGNISPAAWHHFVGTYDGSYIRVYLDGNYVAQVAHAGTMSQTSANLVFGNANSSGWRGLIDEVAIFDRVLSSAEILQLYNGTYPF